MASAAVSPLAPSVANRQLSEYLSRAVAWARSHRWPVALGAVMAGALAIRLSLLDSIPTNVTADEADNMQVIVRIVTGQGPEFFGLDWKPLPAFSAYVQATFMTVLGWSIFSLRLPSALLSTAALLPFYLLARRVVPALPALLAAILLATDPWFLNFSRAGWENVWTATYLLTFIHFLLRGMESLNQHDFIKAGLFAALCLYGYFAGWMVVPILIVAALISTWPALRAVAPDAVHTLDPAARPRQLWRGYAITLGTALILFLPQAFVFFQESSALLRVQAVIAAGSTAGPTGVELYAQQALTTARALLVLATDIPLKPRYNELGTPVLGVVVGALFVTGLVIGALRFRKTALWWIVLVVGLVPVQVFTWGAFDGARAVAFEPFLFLFVALSVNAILAGFARFGRVGRYVSWAATLATLFLAVLNTYEYFTWVQRPPVAAARQPAVELAEFPEWMAAQFVSIRGGRGGFNVGQWKESRGAFSAPVAAAPPVQQPSPPSGARPANASIPTIPVDEGLGPPLGTVGITLTGNDSGAFRNPTGVAVDAAGSFYVADPENARIVQFDATGRSTSQFGSRGSSDDGFLQPFDLAMDRQGRLLVLDSGRSLILRFSATGIFESSMLGGMDAYSPRGISIATNGNVYVADTGRNRVLQLAPDGSLLKTISGPTDDVPFVQPTGVAAAGDGSLYVAEPDVKRLRKLGADGRLLARRELEQSNTRDSPHLAITADGRIALTESGSGRVSLLDANLRRTATLVDRSRGFDRPVGIAVDGAGQVLVVDAARSTVFRVSWP